MNGPKTAGLSDIYGTRCQRDSISYPSSRMEGRAVWTYPSDIFWLFGAQQYDYVLSKSDLWKYCVSTNTWSWVSGDSLTNQIGHCGTLGVSSAVNVPAARSGAVSWSDNNGNLYMFGGLTVVGWERFNDLWKFKVDSLCAPCAANVLPNAMFTFNDSSFCEGVCVDFINQSSLAAGYHWSFPGGSPSSDTTSNPQTICYYLQGNYDVTLIVTNPNGSDTLTLPNAIQVLPPVQFAPLYQHGDTVFSVPGYLSYQWYFDTTLIVNANNYYYVASLNGDYTVQVVDSEGCSAAATLIDVVTKVQELKSDVNSVSVSYATGKVSIEINSLNNSASELLVIDALGQEIYNRTVDLKAGKNYFDLNNVNLSAGIYYFSVQSKGLNQVCKFLVR
jgi:PKD repeat protein